MVTNLSSLKVHFQPWRDKMTSGKHSFLRFIVSVAVLVIAGFALAGEKPRHAEELLLDAYNRNITRLETSPFGLPLFLESFEQGDRVHVDVYGIFDYPFSSIVQALSVPANWCDIVSLHPNTKACTYQKPGDNWLLTFYLGRKIYQPPEDTRQAMYHFRVVDLRKAYLDIILSADVGPLGTKDHKLRFAAVPLDGGRTFVHVTYAYNDSVMLNVAEKIYFSTLGRGKVGFTVTGTDQNGKPVYIGGARGAIERNAVRYYFAIQSFMHALRYPEEKRFSVRIMKWYDLTDRYRRQLFELDKDDYISFKTKEHEHQLTLQGRIGADLK
jgi:hypothetical protein